MTRIPEELLKRLWLDMWETGDIPRYGEFGDCDMWL